MTQVDASSADVLQESLARFVADHNFDDVPERARDATTARLVDTIGALFAGIRSATAEVARAFARSHPGTEATILGFTETSTTDVAAFVNGTTARYAELNDTFHVPGKPGVHASDMITPLLSVAESRRASGRDFVAAVALAYEACLGMLEATSTPGFDQTNLVALGTALGAGKLIGLGEPGLRECVSLTLVSSNALRRARLGDASMWKAAASGHAARAGVTAAQLAAAGMVGPTAPFTGAGGWLETVGTVERSLELGQDPWRIERTIIKPRGACGTTIPAILAAEQAARALDSGKPVTRILVETYADATAKNAQEHHWAPANRETADHSIPYVVAAALTDGFVGPTQFDDDHLGDRRIRDLMRVTEVVDNGEFNAAYLQDPVVHRTRVSVWIGSGEPVVGESGGRYGDISDPMSASDLERKVAPLIADRLPERGVAELLRALWSVADLDDMAVIPPLLVAP